MRIRRSVTRFFTVLLVPAITVAVVSYFGTYAIWGDRGLLRLEEAQSRLALQKQQLTQLQDRRARLAHRIGLMEQAGADPDLVEELARTELMTAAPNQVAVPRR